METTGRIDDKKKTRTTCKVFTQARKVLQTGNKNDTEVTQPVGKKGGTEVERNIQCEEKRLSSLLM